LRERKRDSEGERERERENEKEREREWVARERKSEGEGDGREREEMGDEIGGPDHSFGTSQIGSAKGGMLGWVGRKPKARGRSGIISPWQCEAL